MNKITTTKILKQLQQTKNNNKQTLVDPTKLLCIPQRSLIPRLKILEHKAINGQQNNKDNLILR